jgi:hypothetical protein
MNPRRAIAAWAGVIALIGVEAARADFEVLLREGGTMIVDSYEVSGDKLVAYRGSGKVEFALSRVMNVRDRAIDQAAEAEARKPAPSREPPHWMPPAPRSAGSIVTAEDARAREAELSRAIALAYRDLHFAEYRNDPKDALEKRKAEITNLEAERSSLKSKTGGY